MDTGARVPYDYLVLSSGSTYPCPEIKAARGSLAERKQAYAVRLSPPLPSPSPPLRCQHLLLPSPTALFLAMLLESMDLSPDCCLRAVLCRRAVPAHDMAF